MSDHIEQEYQRWVSHAKTPDIFRELQDMVDSTGKKEDAFYKALSFGTGGLRGVLGAGTNRMNVYVVRRATLGVASYLKKAGLPLRVAISYDSRFNSRLFAEETARVLVASGVEAWIYPRLEPTPALSWAVRALNCGGGVMITASHNPAQYNGYKVYGPDGCQITDGAAEAIWEEINSFDYFQELSDIDKTKLHEIPEEILDEFLREEMRQIFDPLDGLRVVYTPLNGTGLECVKRVLMRAGVAELHVVPEQEKPDGAFPTCPAPNPEKREAMELGLRLCARYKPDILLATDPDCDRVGIAVSDGDAYQLLSGNEIGVLLLDYICRLRIKRNTMPKNPVAVTTIVSTEMADAVASSYGVELKRTLTGFKYIGEQIGLLERQGECERFLFGFEESFGYLSSPHVRDKDGINACLLICSMSAYYKKRGQTLLQVLHELTALYGSYVENLKSVDFEGVDGAIKMAAVMKSLRETPPMTIAEGKVTAVVDYKDGERTGLPSADVLKFQLCNGDRVIIRPSGTEPKLKLYFSVHGGLEQQCKMRLKELEQGMLRLLLN